MIPKAPISPLFKSSLFSWEWYSAAQDDVFFEANTSPCFSSAVNLNPANQTSLRSSHCENNCKLQVVPELESTSIDTTCEESINFASSNQEFTFYVQSPMEKPAQFNDCFFSERRKVTNPCMEILSLPENTPRKLSESEIELLKLLSPSFVGKSPKVLSSAEDRNSTPEDLSVYLPENFTPAPVEKLVSSLEETIFKFPEITEKEVKNQEFEQRDSSDEKGDMLESTKQETTFSESEDSPEIAKECQKRKRVNSVKRATSKLPTRRKRRKTSQNRNEKYREACPDLDESELRNKMERERRTELNLKFNNLRDSIPQLDGNSKASKISILTSAASLCAELETTHERLQKQKVDLKQENNRLWNYLLKLSSK